MHIFVRTYLTNLKPKPIYKNIRHKTLASIALIVTLLINLPRALELFDVVKGLGASFNEVTTKDVLYRAILLFFFSLLVLEFNANFRFSQFKLSSLKNTLIKIMGNGIIFISVVILFQFLYPITTATELTSGDVSLLYFVYLVVLLILVFISRILRFQIIHQHDIAENELLKQENLQKELSALKNQINPHFLFNSLNSLSAMVRDNDDASTFVEKLSFMYRYILQSGQVDLISLREELKFLESYVYLIKTRYREKFNIEINIREELLSEKIPVLVLQLLVENAIKHNEISVKNPLNVKLYESQDYLIVENPIKPRSSFVDSTGNGLENIIKRYRLLIKKSVRIENNNQVFKVMLPLN